MNLTFQKRNSLYHSSGLHDGRPYCRAFLPENFFLLFSIIYLTFYSWSFRIILFRFPSLFHPQPQILSPYFVYHSGFWTNIPIQEPDNSSPHSFSQCLHRSCSNISFLLSVKLRNLYKTPQLPPNFSPIWLL